MHKWTTAHASVIGASHISTNTPCQDASVILTTQADEWLVIVVSDGAGTATRAEEGATYVSQFFSEELIKLVSELNTRAPGHWINDFVIEKVLETRKALRQLSKSDEIRDFNCTLVACLLGPKGGFSIHIGDGAIVGGYRSENQGEVSNHLFISEPENGEYANETFFITEGDWIKHLRITPMPALDWVICCTDGGCSLSMINDRDIKQGFLEPVIKEIFDIKDKKYRNEKLSHFLSDPKANKVTGDDKTIAIAIKLEKTFPNYQDSQELQNKIPKEKLLIVDSEKIYKKNKIQKYFKLLFEICKKRRST